MVSSRLPANGQFASDTVHSLCGGVVDWNNLRAELSGAADEKTYDPQPATLPGRPIYIRPAPIYRP